jgi:hypothetical protein
LTWCVSRLGELAGCCGSTDRHGGRFSIALSAGGYVLRAAVPKTKDQPLPVRVRTARFTAVTLRYLVSPLMQQGAARRAARGRPDGAQLPRVRAGRRVDLLPRVVIAAERHSSSDGIEVRLAEVLEAEAAAAVCTGCNRGRCGTSLCTLVAVHAFRA